MSNMIFMNDFEFQWNYIAGTIIKVNHENIQNVSVSGGGGKVGVNSVRFNDININSTTDRYTRIWLITKEGKEIEEIIPSDNAVRKSHKIVITRINGIGKKNTEAVDDSKSIGSCYYKLYNLTTQTVETVQSVEEMTGLFYNNSCINPKIIEYVISIGLLLGLITAFINGFLSFIIIGLTVIASLVMSSMNKDNLKIIKRKITAISSEIDENIHQLLKDEQSLFSNKIQSNKIEQKVEENRDSALICPKCHTSLTGTEAFCTNCGASLSEKTIYCPQCKQENVSTAKFCQACGTKLI